MLPFDQLPGRPSVLLAVWEGRFSTRAGSQGAVQGWPDTTGSLRRFSFSMPARYSCSSGAQKLTAAPSASARAVRPMRWT